MRFSIISLLSLLLTLNNLEAQKYPSYSDDSLTLIRIRKTADSILASRTGKDIFLNYYRFAPEYSLIKRDTLSTHYACGWMTNSVGRGTSYDLLYSLKGNTFSFQGIHVYLNRNGTVISESEKYPIIPKSIDGKVPTFISRKEAFSIVEEYGMKDTFALSFELLILPQKNASSCVYRLRITFDSKSNHPPTENGEYHYVRNTLLVNPWTKKVSSYRKEEVVDLPPIEDIRDLKEYPPDY